MQKSDSNTDNVSNIDRHFNELSGISFLKRYYNDAYPIADEGLRTQSDGVYFEAIEH